MNDQVFNGQPVTPGKPIPERENCRFDTNGSAANWPDTMSENFLPGQKPARCQTLIRTGDQSAKIAEGQRHEDIHAKVLLHVHDGHAEDELKFDLDRTTTVSKNETTKVGENQKLTVIGDQEVTVNNNQTVKVAGKLRKVEALNITEFAKTIHIQAGTEPILEGPAGQIIKIDSTGITIQGVMVRIN
jgi:hypothetical protein